MLDPATKRAELPELSVGLVISGQELLQMKDRDRRPWAEGASFCQNAIECKMCLLYANNL